MSIWSGMQIERVRAPVPLAAKFTAYKAKLAATGLEDGSIRLWNLETGKEVRKLTGHTQAVWSVCFSPDGKRLLSWEDSTLRIWDVESGKQLKEMRTHKTAAFCAALSPDGGRPAALSPLGFGLAFADVDLYNKERGGASGTG